MEEAGKEETMNREEEPQNARLLRVVYRVKSLDQSVQFYTKCFGMKLLTKCEHTLDNYESAFVGYGPQTTHFIVELRSCKF
eukprot:c26149_g1_i1 orf=170-412(+)